MEKQNRSNLLNRLFGKKIIFKGKFDYGIENSLKAMVEAQQGIILDDLNKSVDYLVLGNLSENKTIQKKVMMLNSNGASIQVTDSDAFKKLIELTEPEVIALLQSSKSELFSKIFSRNYSHHYGQQIVPTYTFDSENFDRVTFTGLDFQDIAFTNCSFIRAQLSNVTFLTATHCNFSEAQGQLVNFNDVQASCFQGAKFKQIHFYSDFSSCNFREATFEAASFQPYFYVSKKNKMMDGVIFSNAILKSAVFNSTYLKSPNFDGADLSDAVLNQFIFESATFRSSILVGSSLIRRKLIGADFSNANLENANFSGTDLSAAIFTGANVKNTNFRGAKLDHVDFSNAKNYDPTFSMTGIVGPALTELDAIYTQAQNIHIKFRARIDLHEEGDVIGISSSGIRYGQGFTVPTNITLHYAYNRSVSHTMSEAILELASLLGNRQVRFETVEVSSTKSPQSGNDLRELVIKAISEAFAQQVPTEEDLATATKLYRAAEREKNLAERECRNKEKAEIEKQKIYKKKQIEKKIEKLVGKVTDIASFLKALEVRIDKSKISKATTMLKSSGFKLFNDVTDEYMSGVVKSQSENDLVYACRINHEGHYSCCTQNLNVCGGLRGSVCKHLLVLIIGLVQASEVDPVTIDSWLTKSHEVKSKLDKEEMGEIFIKYKGAEAGEVDWRPTETMPEDYYSI